MISREQFDSMLKQKARERADQKQQIQTQQSQLMKWFYAVVGDFYIGKCPISMSLHNERATLWAENHITTDLHSLMEIKFNCDNISIIVSGYMVTHVKSLDELSEKICSHLTSLSEEDIAKVVQNET